jgi:hypothetical protein
MNKITVLVVALFLMCFLLFFGKKEFTVFVVNNSHEIIPLKVYFNESLVAEFVSAQEISVHPSFSKKINKLGKLDVKVVSEKYHFDKHFFSYHLFSKWGIISISENGLSSMEKNDAILFETRIQQPFFQ